MAVLTPALFDTSRVGNVVTCDVLEEEEEEDGVLYMDRCHATIDERRAMLALRCPVCFALLATMTVHH